MMPWMKNFAHAGWLIQLSDPFGKVTGEAKERLFVFNLFEVVEWCLKDKDSIYASIIKFFELVKENLIMPPSFVEFYHLHRLTRCKDTFPFLF